MRKRKGPERNRIHKIPINNLKIDSYGEEVMRDPEMRHYMNFWAAQQRNDEEGSREALQQIKELPLALRYTSRIVRALQWGFADFDAETIKIDRKLGLTDADIERLDQGHAFRATQFCMFLSALYGNETMERVMTEAIMAAKQTAKE